jgi:hypothetical protein
MLDDRRPPCNERRDGSGVAHRWNTEAKRGYFRAGAKTKNEARCDGIFSKPQKMLTRQASTAPNNGIFRRVEDCRFAMPAPIGLNATMAGQNGGKKRAAGSKVPPAASVLFFFLQLASVPART